MTLSLTDWLTHWPTFCFLTLKSNSRDLWPLRHWWQFFMTIFNNNFLRKIPKNLSSHVDPCSQGDYSNSGWHTPVFGKIQNVQINSVTQQNSRGLKIHLKKLWRRAGKIFFLDPKLISVAAICMQYRSQNDISSFDTSFSGIRYYLMNIPRCLCCLGHTPVFDKII